MTNELVMGLNMANCVERLPVLWDSLEPLALGHAGVGDGL